MVQRTKLERIMRLAKLGFKLKDALLKTDCEGGEYGLILNSSEKNLRCFTELMIEYHYGYSNLEEKLVDSGFRVEHSMPVKRYNFGTHTFMSNGFLHARRI